jgi:hypothetical protein
MGRGSGTGHHRKQVPFPAWNKRSGDDLWRDYVERNHSLGKGHKTINLDQLFNHELHDVGPVSHFNEGMMPSDLALLRGLASLYKDCSYFEISKRRCESLASMARVAGECYSLCRPAGEIRREGIRRGYMYMMGYYSAAMQNVVALSGDSNTFPFSSLDKKFDVVFINNGHGYNRILNDTRKAFEYLVHDRSVVVWHDYSYFPEQVRWEVLAGILDGTDPLIREQLFFVSRTKCAIFLPIQIIQTWIPAHPEHSGS